MAFCSNGFSAGFTISASLRNTPSIQGKQENSKYLYVTAAPKIYSIGNQAGQFPPVGFHISGEMGGIWMQPLKLFDGFAISVNGAELAKANKFTAYPYASQFIYNLNGLSIIRTDFAADTVPVLVTEITLKNKTTRPRMINLGMLLKSHLSPTWLSERQGIINGEDLLYSSKSGILLIKDSRNTWYSGICQTGLTAVKIEHPTLTHTKKTYPITGSILLPAHKERVVRFYLSGSIVSAQEVSDNLAFVSRHIVSVVADKKKRYEDIDRTAAVSIPDKELAQAYTWGKYNTDWLVRNIPGMGRGLSAGLPDYPWFFSNDQAATFSAIVGTTDAGVMTESLGMLMRHSNEFNHNNGRIIHEMSANGQVYDKGRMEESQKFIDAIWNVYRWTGNRQLLLDGYAQGLKIYDFLMDHDQDHDLYVEGYGGVEIEGLNDEMFDVACHTAQFFEQMRAMCVELGQNDQAQMFAQKADTLRRKINKDWWCQDENRYYDMLTDTSTALKLIDMALKNFTSDTRNRWAKEHLTNLKHQIDDHQYTAHGYNIFYNPSTVALTTSVADTSKARLYLQHVPFFCNKFGLYISGISRPDDIHLEENSVAFRLHGDFNYKQAIMVGATSELAIAECMYNNPDLAYTYIKKILNNFSFATPGTTYEVCPDYGMFVQAWNVGGINKPLIQYFFGMSPMASHRHVDLNPTMPSAWSNATINNVLIGSNHVGLSFSKKSGITNYTVTSEEEGWTFDFHLPQGATHIVVNGTPIADEPAIVRLYGKSNNICYQ